MKRDIAKILPCDVEAFRDIRYGIAVEVRDENAHLIGMDTDYGNYVLRKPVLHLPEVSFGNPLGLTADEISQSLTADGFSQEDIKHVTMLKNSFVLRVSRPTFESWSKIGFQIYFARIKHRGRHRIWIPQCKRCGGLHHKQEQCSRDPRCLFCAGQHQIHDCPNQEVETLRKCCLCGSKDHSANNISLCQAAHEAKRKYCQMNHFPEPSMK